MDGSFPLSAQDTYNSEIPKNRKLMNTFILKWFKLNNKSIETSVKLSQKCRTSPCQKYCTLKFCQMAFANFYRKGYKMVKITITDQGHEIGSNKNILLSAC